MNYAQQCKEYWIMQFNRVKREKAIIYAKIKTNSSLMLQLLKRNMRERSIYLKQINGLAVHLAPKRNIIITLIVEIFLDMLAFTWTDDGGPVKHKARSMTCYIKIMKEIITRLIRSLTGCIGHALLL